jgi:hypothetical protein
MTRAVSAALALLIAVGLVAVVAEGTHVMSKEPRFPQLTIGATHGRAKAVGRGDHEGLQRRPGRPL